ncbi:MAG: RCC1 domain-containing protein, partial [Myxococcota bacterium]
MSSSGGVCALLENGSLHCWGDPRVSGYGDSVYRFEPDTKPLNFKGKKVKQVSMGVMHSCALLENHKVHCWSGYPIRDWLGYGDTKIRTAPTHESLDFQGQDVSSISLGAGYGCAIMNDGNLRCW